MDVHELFACCRSGDLEKIRFLVEQRDVDVNIRDIWDSTPLYYACLCGHNAIVEYLIGVGARCEANTFDGERCLYGALTDEIRRTLKQHSLITAHTIRRDAYNEFLRRVYEKGEESDITIVVQNKKYFLHKCLLAARSPYFCHMLSSKWRHRNIIHINNSVVHQRAFDCVMQYLYTGRFECSFELIDQCLIIANNCKLPMFKSQLDEALKRAEFLQLEKQGRVRITTVVIEPEDCLEGAGIDLRDLAQSTLPTELRVWPTEMPFMQPQFPSFADVCFVVEGKKFLCHKMFFSPRSEYFRAILADHFNESFLTVDQDFPLPSFNLQHISTRIFTVVVMYLYCNQILDVISAELAVEVLTAADMYLLPGLKRQCGVYLGNQLTVPSVFDTLQVARLFALPRLEDQCVAFAAKNFTQLLEDDLLREIIVSDVEEVHERQETDSVTFVDELRYHLSSNLCSISDIEEAREKLSLLERILEDLGIDV